MQCWIFPGCCATKLPCFPHTSPTFRAWNFLVPIFGRSSSSPQDWLGRNVSWGNGHDFTIQAVIETMKSQFSGALLARWRRKTSEGLTPLDYAREKDVEGSHDEVPTGSGRKAVRFLGCPWWNLGIFPETNPLRMGINMMFKVSIYCIYIYIIIRIHVRPYAYMLYIYMIIWYDRNHQANA